MKYIIKSLCFAATCLASVKIFAQNTFPSSGNVGIGTSSPLHLLHVTGTGYFSGDSYFNDVMIGRGGGQVSSNTAVGFNALYSNTTGHSNAMFGLNSGFYNTTGLYNSYFGRNAGYGSTSGSTGDYNTAIGYYTLTSISSGYGNTVFGSYSGSGISSGTYNVAIGYNSLAAVSSSNFNTCLGYATATTKTGTGIVAVGGYALSSSAAASDYSTAVGYAALQIASGNSNTAFGAQAGYSDGNTFTGSYNNFIGRGSGYGLLSGSYNTVLGTNGYIGDVSNHVIIADGQGHNRIVINDEGKVGIGTTSGESLSEKLSVNGNVKAKKLIVTQLGWSDYVFAKDYQLRTLSSLETFIKNNSRLPEIPSAGEVEEKGISVGDNQALLLKKIEELTLYIIQQQKQIDKLSSEVRAIKGRK